MSMDGNFLADMFNCKLLAINSGSTGGRYWFGHVFRGGATTVANYERDEEESDGVTDAIAYTIVA